MGRRGARRTARRTSRRVSRRQDAMSGGHDDAPPPQAAPAPAAAPEETVDIAAEIEKLADLHAKESSPTRRLPRVRRSSSAEIAAETFEVRRLAAIVASAASGGGQRFVAPR